MKKTPLVESVIRYHARRSSVFQRVIRRRRASSRSTTCTITEGDAQIIVTSATASEEEELTVAGPTDRPRPPAEGRMKSEEDYGKANLVQQVTN